MSIENKKLSDMKIKQIIMYGSSAYSTANRDKISIDEWLQYRKLLRTNKNLKRSFTALNNRIAIMRRIK